MKKSYLSACLCAALLLGGCATPEQNQVLETNIPKAQEGTEATITKNKDLFPQITKEAYFAQDENIKKAIVILINTTEKLENQLILVSNNLQRTSKQLSDALQDIDSNKKTMSEYERKISGLEKNSTLLLNKIADMNKTIQEKKVDVNVSTKNFKGKAVWVIDKRIQILKAPSPDSEKIGYAYYGQKFSFDAIENGYYHLTKKNGWANSKFLKEVNITQNKGVPKVKNKEDEGKKNTIKNTKKSAQIPKDVIIEHKPNVSSEDEFLSDKKTVTTSKKADTNTGAVIANNLALNKNVTESNVKEQCIAGLLQKGIKASSNKEALDQCIKVWTEKTKTKMEEKK